MRRTQTMLTVAEVLLANSSSRFWGYDLCKTAGVKPGSVYPMLTKFLEAGWLVDGWERPEGSPAGRPPRRYYTLTDDGVRDLLIEVAAGRATGGARRKNARGWVPETAKTS